MGYLPDGFVAVHDSHILVANDHVDRDRARSVVMQLVLFHSCGSIVGSQDANLSIIDLEL